MGDPLPTDDCIKQDALCRWEQLAPCTQWVWEALEKAYTEPGRHYHTLQHIRLCLTHEWQVLLLLENPRAVRMAIWFHDIVYDPTRSDNEQRSADLAARYLDEMAEPPEFIARVRELILDTRHKSPPATTDGRYLVDIDLAILGAPPDEFDAYERAIRLEYAHVDDEAFRRGRAAVLRHFLARPSIYATEFFRSRYEAAARANLERSLAALEVPHR